MTLLMRSFRGLLASLFVVLALAASGERRLAQLQLDQIGPYDLGNGDELRGEETIKRLLALDNVILEVITPDRHVIDRAIQSEVFTFTPGRYSLAGERPLGARSPPLAPLGGSHFPR